jgi:hypothetical protein
MYQKWCLGLFVLATVLQGCLATNKCDFGNITYSGVTDTSARLSWSVDYDCKKTVTQFKVYTHHAEYAACGDGKGDKKLNNVYETEADTQLVMTNLHPFSSYEIQVVGLMDDDSVSGKVKLTTKPGIPDTRPSKSSKRPQAFKQALKFFWLPPPKEDCKMQNGVSEGYLVELWGLDLWVVSDKPAKSNVVVERIEEIYLEGLEPYTNYKVKVFSRNEKGSYNRNLALEQRSRTMSVLPNPPLDVRLTPAQNSIHVHWKPPYPPTGEVDRFVVRVGINSTDGQGGPVDWLHRNVVQGNRSCIKGASGITNPVCHVVIGLEADTVYIVELKTFNVGVKQGSYFSEAVIAMTEPDANRQSTLQPSETETISPRTPRAELDRFNGEEESENGGTNQTLVVIIGLVVALIVLIIICFALVYKIKMNKLRLVYEQQSTLARQNRTNMAESLSYLPAGSEATGTSYVQDWTSQLQDIQSRRLPEPPPIKRSSLVIPTEDELEKPSAYSDDGYVDMVPTDDMGGYLAPTFLQPPIQTSTPKRRSKEEPPSPETVIPPQSYVSPSTLQDQCNSAAASTKPAGTTNSNESHPLMPMISHPPVDV